MRTEPLEQTNPDIQVLDWAEIRTVLLDMDGTLLDSAYQTLSQDLIEAEQVQFLEMLRLFWRDLEAYRDQPDMSQQQLLTLAVR